MELFVQQAVFVEFRPIFFVLLLISLLFLLFSFIPRGRNSKVNLVTVVIVSIIQTLLAGTSLYVESSLAEKFEVVGDRLTLYLFVGILLLSIINPILFRSRNRNKNKGRYRYKY